MQVKIKKLREDAIIPTYGTPASAGFDLYLLPDEEITLAPGETYLAHLGISMEIPDGYVGLVFARSGLATKRTVAPANKVGVVDSDYRGEFMVPLHNHGKEPVTLAGGERVAQMILMPYLRAEFVLSDELSDTERGTSGFGSTGRT